MGQIKKLYQDNENVETTVTTESNAVYPITAASAVYYSGAWGNLGNNKDTQAILTALDGGHQFMGVATASTNPSTPTHKVFYIASEPGTYSHFGNISVTGLCVLKSNGSNWTKQDLNITIDSGGDSPTSIDGFIGITRVQSTAGAQDLRGISNLYLTDSAKIYWGGTGQVYLEYTSNGFHFSQAVYSDEEMAAGGIGSGGSGTGGVTIDRVWQSITANTEHVDEKINVAHIPNITVSKITDIEDWIEQKGYLTEEVEPAYSNSAASTITSEMITTWNSIPVVTESVVSGWGFTKSPINQIQLNGSIIIPNEGVVDLGTILTSSALSNYVNKTEVESVGGAKTFTDQMTVKGIVPSVNATSSSYSEYSLGSSNKRFYETFTQYLHTSDIEVKSGTVSPTTVSISPINGSAYLSVGQGGTSIAFIMNSSALHPSANHVDLGTSSSNWDTLYISKIAFSSSTIQENNGVPTFSKNVQFSNINDGGTTTNITIQNIVDRIVALEASI